MLFFFFNDTATTEIYTLSLHDALPIYDARDVGRAAVEVQVGDVEVIVVRGSLGVGGEQVQHAGDRLALVVPPRDRKSTRLNSSHANISYAVFCLKKKKKTINSESHDLI